MIGVRRKVEFIEKPKERASRFITRKKGLINKANELSILCGVDCCVIIINEENNNNLGSVDHVWSSSSEKGVVGDLISKYKEECGPKRSYNNNNLDYVDRKRKAESVLASAKKRNREGVRLPTWNSKFESMNEYELRNLASDLDIRLDNMKNHRRELMMKNKRLKTVINDSPPGPGLIEDNDGCNIDMNPVAAMNSLDQESVMDPMVAIEENDSCNLDMNPTAPISSLEQAIVIDKIVTMNSIENNDSCNLLQPISVIEPDVVNEIMPAMLDDTTLTDLQQQLLYDPSHPFVSSDSGAQTEADVFSDSFLMSPAMIGTDVREISTDVRETSDYNWNVFDFSLFDCFSMQEAYGCGNSQMQNCVPSQTLPPLML